MCFHQETVGEIEVGCSKVQREGRNEPLYELSVSANIIFEIDEIFGKLFFAVDREMLMEDETHIVEQLPDLSVICALAEMRRADEFDGSF